MKTACTPDMNSSQMKQKNLTGESTDLQAFTNAEVETKRASATPEMLIQN
jgi:hypothetical protein